MATLPNIFDGKHIRVEIYLAGLKLDYRTMDHNCPDTRDTILSEFNNTFFDTLVIRDNKVDLIKEYEVTERYEDAFKHHLIKFDIDTLKKEIYNLFFTYEYIDGFINYDKSEEEELRVSFQTDSVSYSLAGDNIICNLDMKNSNIWYKKKDSYATVCPGHFQWWDMISIAPEDSYIKIEIID